MRRTRGWAARGPASLHMVELERRDLRPEDIALRVDYCGVCHSDLHALHEYAQRTAGAESSEDPFVPGHECTGTVTEVGTEVTRFAVGDTEIGRASCRERGWDVVSVESVKEKREWRAEQTQQGE